MLPVLSTFLLRKFHRVWNHSQLWQNQQGKQCTPAHHFLCILVDKCMLTVERYRGEMMSFLGMASTRDYPLPDCILRPDKRGSGCPRSPPYTRRGNRPYTLSHLFRYSQPYTNNSPKPQPLGMNRNQQGSLGIVLVRHSLCTCPRRKLSNSRLEHPPSRLAQHTQPRSCT